MTRVRPLIATATALALTSAVAVALIFGRLPADAEEEAVTAAPTTVTTTVTETVDMVEARFSRSEPTTVVTPTEWQDPEPWESLQATFYNMRTGETVGTSNQHEPRAALSLAKLYIADYVLEHGSEDEGYAALRMVSDSSDSIADVLHQRYPSAINEVARSHDLDATDGGRYWGYSVTSTHDVVSFLKDLYDDDPHHPILTAMSLATPTAADGYEQDFGTAVLSGAYGTKWGWSNDQDNHASATVGDGWIAAVASNGSSDDLSEVARAQLEDLAEQALDG